MNRVGRDSSVDDGHAPVRTQVPIKPEPLNIIPQTRKIRLPSERHFWFNIHKEGKSRPRKETKELEAQP
jgi:hypothetical protein